ncbi:hypothetical protein GCM10018780_88150 [Streptomyces lanatus]|nr:hypothetical protein GCM10018780_88150 [Streptomyces lanatus]
MERGDVWDGVPGLPRAAARALQAASADELTDTVEADAELLRGLVRGEVTGPDHLRFHDPMVSEERRPRGYGGTLAYS